MKLMTRSELAERWGTSLRSVDRVDDLPRVKIGQKVRYRIEDVERWEAEHRENRYGLKVAA